MEAIGYDTGPYAWAITPTHLAAASNIRMFKVVAAAIGAPHSKQLNGDLHLQIGFANALSSTLTQPVLADDPATLEIGQFNHVLIYLLS